MRKGAVFGTVFVVLVLSWLRLGGAQTPDNPFAGVVSTVPAGTLYCQIHPEGTTVIPNGRLLTPRGRQILVEPRPLA